MAADDKDKISRREFLEQSAAMTAVTAAGLGAALLRRLEARAGSALA